MRLTSGGSGDELAVLMQGLIGAQANDSGWPMFNGKYVEYPRFRKEWRTGKGSKRQGDCAIICYRSVYLYTITV
jgi:hypothetical protein